MTELQDLRFTQIADVYKAGIRAARLHRHRNAVEFRYRSEYLHSGAPAVGSTLPLDAEPRLTHAAGALPTFFAGLLPEGRRLSALRRAVKTSADDEFTLLLAVGADTIGDVQVVPEGMAPTAAPVIETDAWSTLRFAELYARLESADGPSRPDRVGLPGVQDKVSAAMITLPLSTARIQYILKLNPPEFPFLVENEAFFLDVARRCGLHVTDAELVRDADGQTGLAVRRFDRLVGANGDTLRLAQEDGCQALDRYPADKYNVSAEDVSTALVSLTRARPVAARDLLRQITFAYLTGNGDAHAKNFSVLCDRDGEWRISPAYDLPSSQPYGDHTLALSVAGRLRNGLGRDHLLQLAATIGLREPAARRTVDGLVEAVEGWIDDLDRLPFDERRLHKLRREILQRRNRLRAR